MPIPVAIKIKIEIFQYKLFPLPVYAESKEENINTNSERQMKIRSEVRSPRKFIGRMKELAGSAGEIRTKKRSAVCGAPSKHINQKGRARSFHERTRAFMAKEWSRRASSEWKNGRWSARAWVDFVVYLMFRWIRHSNSIQHTIIIISSGVTICLSFVMSLPSFHMRCCHRCPLSSQSANLLTKTLLGDRFLDSFVPSSMLPSAERQSKGKGRDEEKQAIVSARWIHETKSVPPNRNVYLFGR